MKHLRFGRVPLALACAGDAAAQINERDRLERCANNRTAIAAIEVEMLGAVGWTQKKIDRARTVASTMVSAHRGFLGRVERHATLSATLPGNPAVSLGEPS